MLFDWWALFISAGNETSVVLARVSGECRKYQIPVTVHAPMFSEVLSYILCGNPEFFSTKSHLFVISVNQLS